MKLYKYNFTIRYAVCIVLAVLLATVFFASCTKQSDNSSKTVNSADAQAGNSSGKTQAEPKTLEQALLKNRGIDYKNSDYKKFEGGEGILSFETAFPDISPTITGTDRSSVFIVNGKIYKFLCDDTLPGGKNCVAVCDLPVSAKPIYIHSRDVNGADLDVIFEGGRRFSMEAVSNGAPYAFKESKYGMIYFEHTYEYSNDGKTLSEIQNFKNTVTYFDSHIVLANGKIYAYERRKVKDNSLTSPIYFDDKNNGFIIWDVNCSEFKNDEKIITVFNGNILVTDKGFYKIVYDDVPDNLKSNTEKTTDSDGTFADYLPKFGGGNRYALKKIELLSKYYGDVLTVTQTSVITKDYKILPLTEIIPAENKYSKYDFGDIEIPEAISKKIN